MDAFLEPSQPIKIYFQVLIDYVKEATVPKFESLAIGSFEEATSFAKTTAQKLSYGAPGSNVVELEPEEQDGVYHLLVIDQDGSEVVVKIGIIATDYSEVTIH